MRTEVKTKRDELIDILVSECYTVESDGDIIRVWPTGWDYEEPYIIHNDDELMETVIDVLKSGYIGLPCDCVPKWCIDYLGEGWLAEFCTI